MITIKNKLGRIVRPILFVVIGLLFVRRIVIYSKEVDDKTKLPWRRAEKNPAVPYKISIELKLPQGFIDSFFDFDPTPFNGNPTQSWDDDNLVDKIEKWNIKLESESTWKDTFNDASGLIHTKHSNAPVWFRSMRLGFHIFSLFRKKESWLIRSDFSFFINYFAPGQLRSYRDLRGVEA